MTDPLKIRGANRAKKTRDGTGNFKGVKMKTESLKYKAITTEEIILALDAVGRLSSIEGVSNSSRKQLYGHTIEDLIKELRARIGTNKETGVE